MMVKLELILQSLEETFRVSEFPDYGNALNGLQVEGPDRVSRLAVAVDASEATIQAALVEGADMLLVHHGLFWDGFGPIAGPRFRKVAHLIRGSMGLYALHLPLDAHPEYGNCILLARALGLEPEGRFATFKGAEIGWWARTDSSREDLQERLEEAVGGSVGLIPGGGGTVRRVGIVTGGGASSLSEAASMGLDALVTGEAAHHHFHEAMELGINLFLGGHYATETFGVRAVGEMLNRAFGVDWVFLDLPTGM